jgi:glycosyltransferase involved in cell wall biosynthesis
MKIALCLLTWNEIDGCRHDVPKLKLDAFDEVFAIDNESTDGTVGYLESRGIKVFRQDLPTYNGAYHSAFKHCRSEALIFFHPKGSINPIETLKFKGYFEKGYDLIVASRIINGAVNEEDRRIIRPRKWFVMGLGLLAKFFWGKDGNTVWDVLHGFRGIRKDSFYAMETLQSGVTMDLETVVRAYRKNLRRIEFPVHEQPRFSGGTHFKAWPTGKKLLRYLSAELMRKT